MTDHLLQPLEAYLEALRRRRDRDKRRIEHPEPPAEPLEAQHLNYVLRRGDPPAETRLIKPGLPLAPPVSVATVRREIYNRILDFARGDENGVLLVRVPAGLGKTYHAIRAVQALAQDGQRILYTADRHNFWHDLVSLGTFDPEWWYHWQPIRAADKDTGAGETCRYAENIITWIRRGYPAIEFCKQMCVDDQHIKRCPYRLQARQPERIIYAMHQHLISGMAISDYSLAVIDEFPIRAFLDHRYIPHRQIVPQGGTEGPMGDLFQWLEYLTASGDVYPRERPDPYIRGRELLEIIGRDLTTVYNQIEISGDIALPVVPRLDRPEQAHDVANYYWQDLLAKLSPEFECWQKDWKDWIGRVRILPKKWLEILGRKHVWESLPGKCVILDATGEPGVYRQLFNGPMTIYEPNVERVGAIHQVVGRLYGSRHTLKEVEGIGPRGGKGRLLSDHGKQMLEMCKVVAGEYAPKRVGIITFKDAVGEFEEHFGEGNVAYFGALRGTNILQDVACLIVAGGYCPPLTAIQDNVAMIFPDRMESFFERNEEGTILSPWRPAIVEYRVKDDVRAWRMHSGFWDDAELDLVLNQSRRSELVQAIHRARPNMRECDVWVLTSIPTGEILDGIYQDLSETDLAPKRDKAAKTGIVWRHWLRIKPWLDEQWNVGAWVDAQALAEQADTPIGTVRVQRWLHTISEHEPDRWLLTARRVGRGRPRLGIQAVEVIDEKARNET